MGRGLFILLILGFFVFVFFKSDTLETITSKSVNEVNIEMSSAKYSIHWDRFFDYLKNLSREWEDKAKSLVRQ